MKCPRCGGTDFRKEKLQQVHLHYGKYPSPAYSPYYAVCKRCGFAPTLDSGPKGGGSASAGSLVHGLRVFIDFEDEKGVLYPSGFLSGWISKALGKGKVEEHFEVIDTTERLIRSLKRMGYRNIMEVEIDGHVLYEHPERARDARDAIRSLAEKAHESRSAKKVRIKAMRSGHPKGIAEVFVRRVHKGSIHAIKLEIDSIEAEDVRELVKTLEDKLGTKRIKYVSPKS